MQRRSNNTAKAVRSLRRVAVAPQKKRTSTARLRPRLFLAALTLSVAGVGALDGCSAGVSNDAAPTVLEPIAECSAYAERLTACASRASAKGGAAMAARRASIEADLLASAKDDASRETVRARCAAAVKVLATSCR